MILETLSPIPFESEKKIFFESDSMNLSEDKTDIDGSILPSLQSFISNN